MENLQAILQFFSRIWDLFSIPHPLLGVPIGTIYLGIFSIAFSITILKPLLGIGAGVIADIRPRRRGTGGDRYIYNNTNKFYSYNRNRNGSKKQKQDNNEKSLVVRR